MTDANVIVHKAIPIKGEPSPNLLIQATEPLMESADKTFDLKTHVAYLDIEAKAIVDALIATLPQGVVFRIHAHLAMHYTTDVGVVWKRMKGD